jgi:hypothetical protein
MAKPRSTRIVIDPPIIDRDGHVIDVQLVALSHPHGSERLADAIRAELPEVSVTRSRGDLYPRLTIECDASAAMEVRERITRIVGEVQP